MSYRGAQRLCTFGAYFVRRKFQDCHKTRVYAKGGAQRRRSDKGEVISPDVDFDEVLQSLYLFANIEKGIVPKSIACSRWRRRACVALLLCAWTDGVRRFSGCSGWLTKTNDCVLKGCVERELQSSSRERRSADEAAVKKRERGVHVRRRFNDFKVPVHFSNMSINLGSFSSSHRTPERFRIRTKRKRV